MDFTFQEVLDLTQAILDAQRELCIGDGFPEATAYHNRLEALRERLTQFIINGKEAQR